MTGIKAIAMLLLFWWHSGIPSPYVDLGGRSCEILFVASGFLVGYNYYSKKVPVTWKASFDYFFNKIIKFWPLHIIVLLAMILYTVLRNGYLTIAQILTAVVNGLLLQAWSGDENVFFSYNGASWFLSALVFCYFLSPLFLRFCKKIKQSLMLFVIVFFIRFLLEYVCNHIKSMVIFDLNVHTSPIIRCLEFFMGMLMIPTFLGLRKKCSNFNGMLFSLIEFATLILVITLVLWKNDVWLRGGFVLLFCLFIFVFAFDGGIFSKFFSNKVLKAFGKIQFEFFIFHQPIIVMLTWVCQKYITDWKILTPLIFLTIIACSIVYKVFCEKKLSAIMQSGYNKALKLIC